jgi:peptidoglycan/xylan/chitin deacetylase (PgdA/CDA1 family)
MRTSIRLLLLLAAATSACSSDDDPGPHGNPTGAGAAPGTAAAAVSPVTNASTTGAATGPVGNAGVGAAGPTGSGTPDNPGAGGSGTNMTQDPEPAMAESAADVGDDSQTLEPQTGEPEVQEPAALPDAMPENLEPSVTAEPDAAEPDVDDGASLASNPSGLPEPGAGGQALPSGVATNLRVLDWAGFTAAMTYTFDDTNSSQIQNWDQLDALGVPFTFYMWTGKNEAGNGIWADALEKGHELGNHTQSHQGSGANLGADTDAASEYIMSNYGVTAWTMAAPNGSTSYIEVARTRFMINRGVADGQISPGSNADALNLNGWIPPTGAGADPFIQRVDRVRNSGSWQVVTIHGFSGGSDGAYQPISLDGFINSVEYARDLGDVWIGTMENVGAYWLGQKLFDAASPQTSGETQTWSWTLPELFPPGKYLRVVVDGGTLSQDGTTLPWNEHGFYEVALDAGSLSLSP